VTYHSSTGEETYSKKLWYTHFCSRGKTVDVATHTCVQRFDLLLYKIQRCINSIHYYYYYYYYYYYHYYYYYYYYREGLFRMKILAGGIGDQSLYCY